MNALPKNPNIMRCRLVRLVGGFPQSVIYLGPLDSIPKGWSIQMRAVAIKRGVAA